MSAVVPAQAAIGMPASEIIIVDDNEDWRDMLAAILELEGHAVTGFSNGTSFLEQAADRTPICVFLDVFMPGPSGLDVLQKLAAIEYRAPVFLITARADAAVVLQGIRYGVLGVIEKPFDPYSAILRVRQAADLWANRSARSAASSNGGSRFAADARLTNEECAMLTQIANGTSVEQAAKDLGISTRAAAKCRAEMKKRFGVKRFAKLVRIAINEIALAKQDVVDAAPAAAAIPAPAKRFGRPKRKAAPASRPRRRSLAGERRDPR